MSETQVTNNRGQQRYEAIQGDAVAGFASYRASGDNVLVMDHTVVDRAYEGQGIGSALARFALDDIRSQGAKVVPQCSFIASWIDKHPDYQDLVTDR